MYIHTLTLLGEYLHFFCIYIFSAEEYHGDDYDTTGREIHVLWSHGITSEPSLVVRLHVQRQRNSLHWMMVRLAFIDLFLILATLKRYEKDESTL